MSRRLSESFPGAGVEAAAACVSEQPALEYIYSVIGLLPKSAWLDFRRRLSEQIIRPESQIGGIFQAGTALINACNCYEFTW
jgi:alkyl hydroperoxide reductase subunit AhpF